MGVSLKWKLILTTTTLVLSVIIASGITSSYVMKRGVIDATERKLYFDISSTMEILDRTYPGEWYVQDGILYKNKIKINGNIDLADRLGVITGDMVAVYQGNKSIISNARDENGDRIVGDTVEPEIEKTVLQEGKDYIGLVKVGGQKYLKGYWPLRDENGDIIAMWSVGVPMAHLDSMVSNQYRLLMYMAVIALIISFSIILVLALYMFKPIREIILSMQRVEKGELTVKTGFSHKKNEVGQLARSYENMLQKLADIVGQTQKVSVSVKDSSADLTKTTTNALQSTKQCAVSMGEVASSNQEQTGNIQEMSAAASQLNEIVNKVTDDIDTIQQYSDNVVQEARDGISYMDSMQEQVSTISERVTETSATISELDERSQKIGRIIVTIREIAEKTSLLALNAAIEAARAGENGKGFAVVAEEVRSLAAESNSSSSEITELILEVQEQTEKAVEYMHESVNETDKGRELVTDTHHKFKKIIDSIDIINHDLEKIVEATKEMKDMTQSMVDGLALASSNSEQVTLASNEVSAFMEQQSLMMNSIHKATERLQEMANNMEQSVEQFRI